MHLIRVYMCLCVYVRVACLVSISVMCHTYLIHVLYVFKQVNLCSTYVRHEKRI